MKQKYLILNRLMNGEGEKPIYPTKLKNAEIPRDKRQQVYRRNKNPK